MATISTNTAPDTIAHETLARLAEAGAVRGTRIIGQPGGWGVVIQYGSTERALAAKTGAVRIFRKFETLVNYLKSMGIALFQVDATLFDADALKSKRTRADSAERMKNAHAAAEHDKWFRAQVELAIQEADAPDAVWIPHEVVKQDMAKQRAALLARIESQR